MKEINLIQKFLENTFGIKLIISSTIDEQGLSIFIQPNDIPVERSFYIKFSLGWRSISGIFTLGAFAGSLLKQINNSNESQKVNFNHFLLFLCEKGCEITTKINEKIYLPNEMGNWPEKWESFEISFLKKGVIIENDNKYDFNVASEYIYDFYALSICLLPLNEDSYENILEENEHHYEGNILNTYSIRYERNKVNREIAIRIHGTNCMICNMNFENIYGYFAKDYIHIHHITPLSVQGGQHLVDPKNDLIPVCPNCHAVLHMRNPPYTPAEIKARLKG